MERIEIKGTLISYDPKADALYVKMREGKVAKTIEYSEDIFVDLNSHNVLIGIELLSPSEVSTAEVRKIAQKFHTPSLRPFNPRAVHSIYACA